MESCGDTPQSRRTSSGLSDSSVGMAGTDRTRDCAGERSRIETDVFASFPTTISKIRRLSKRAVGHKRYKGCERWECTTNKAASGIETCYLFTKRIFKPNAPQTKPRAALKLTDSLTRRHDIVECTTNKAASGIETRSRRRIRRTARNAPQTKPRAALKPMKNFSSFRDL